MELAATAFMAMAPTATAGAAATAAAASTAGAATAGTLGALQGVFSTAALISTALGGVSSYQSSQSRARFADLDATSERLSAEAETLRIKRDYLTKVGAARVAFAGSGLDISSGDAIEGSLKDQADYETSLAVAGGQSRAAQSLARGSAMRDQGTAGLISAAGKMAEIGADWSVSKYRRG